MMRKLANPIFFWSILIAANIAMYLCTIVISFLWSKLNGYKTLKVTLKDVYVSLAILLVNVLVAIPGYFLFLNGSITFTMTDSFIIDFLLLYVVFDFGMYSLHLISHYVWPFRNYHQKHHTHQHFNAISLYVMEPVESLLFGLLLTVSVLFVPLNFYSFIAFIFLNWILGVIGHLNTNATKQPLLFSNHVFHKTHHQHGNSNFGFYTVIWDRIFGTFYQNP